jgi:hypothetical protein
MQTLVTHYGTETVSQTQRPGYLAYPYNDRLPGSVAYDKPSGYHGITQKSIQYPKKQVHTHGNYVTQNGVPLWKYNVNMAQMASVRMNPVPAERVPVNANVMRIVGRATTEEGTNRGAEAEPNPSGDLIRDPVMRGQYRILEFANGQRVSDRALRNNLQALVNGLQQPGRAPGQAPPAGP